MGREGQQAEYDIYPRGLTEPWDARRFGVGEALYASLGIPREDKRGRLAQFMHNYTGFGAPVMLFLHCSRVMGPPQWADRSEEHTSELQSLMRISYAVFC